MDQSTHAWIAIRAVALLEDEGSVPELVALLKPCAQKAAIGAWIPDKADARQMASGIECHVLKMQPLDAKKTQSFEKKRFVADKKELLKRLGNGRAMATLLKEDTTLSTQWWSQPYRGEPGAPGHHVANRAMALATTVTDLLVLGDPEVDELVPGENAFIDDVAEEARTSCSQAALCFLMLSHFVADACMPCHCDRRALSKYKDGYLHEQLEKHWSRLIGDGYNAAALEASTSTPDELLEQAREVDGKIGIRFDKAVPQMGKGTDVWLDMVNVCRASFAVASIMAPPSEYDYGGKKMAKLTGLFTSESDPQLGKIDQAVLHDAVLNTAIVWKEIWQSMN